MQLTDPLMVNYFPRVNGGWEMWQTYDGPTYQADLEAAGALGFGTVRVILAAKDGAFDFPTPTGTQLTNLADLYSRSKTVGIKVRLCLFDQFPTPGYIAGCQTWLAAVLGALPDFDNVHSVEIRNEVPFASTDTYSGGFDSGWPSGTTQYTTTGPVVQVWSQQVIPAVRAAAAGVPVTVSCTAVYNPAYDATGHLRAGVAALTGTSAPDWWEYHFYPVPPDTLTTALTVLSAAAQAVSPLGLLIGETGLDSAVYSPQEQADFIQAVRWACGYLNLPEPAPWILYDMEPSAQFAPGQTYGLIDTSGTDKPAATMFRAWPPGQTPPPGTITVPSPQRAVTLGDTRYRLT